jgi:thiol-disulfide isomerase/thioredoxin
MVSKQVEIERLLIILYTVFPENYRNSHEGIQYRVYLQSNMIRKDKPSPAFEITDTNGKLISSSNYKDHLLLVFWASWCRPCIKKMPIINRMKYQFADKKLDFLFVTSDLDSSNFFRAIEKHKIAWGTHTFLNDDLKKEFGVSSIPKVYLISPEGYILYYNQEEKDEKLIKLVQVLNKELR